MLLTLCAAGALRAQATAPLAHAADAGGPLPVASVDSTVPGLPAADTVVVDTVAADTAAARDGEALPPWTAPQPAVVRTLVEITAINVFAVAVN
ncbi:MAG: hypothetical protein MUC69_07175, partial [Gemmatimonadales bacterium]|nr:hypothetical protein [Gemmatimonadales bacterium]